VTLSYNDFRGVVPSAQSVDDHGAVEPDVLAADQAVPELHDSRMRELIGPRE
jgi:hypothetical protein